MRILFLCKTRARAEDVAQKMVNSLGQVDIYARHVNFVKVQLQDMTCIFCREDDEILRGQQWDVVWRETDVV